MQFASKHNLGTIYLLASWKFVMLFNLGNIVATPGALDLLKHHNIEPAQLLSRHLSGDYGEIDELDKEMNREAVQCGYRVFSSNSVGNQHVWVITEASRDQTTIMLPEEY